MPLPVKLSDVVDHMDMVNDDAVTYLNRLTGEFVFVSEEAMRAAENEDDWDDLPDWESEEMPEIKEAIESRRLYRASWEVRNPRVVHHGGVCLLRG